MTINLPKDVEGSINAEVLSRHFASPDDLVAEIVRDYFRHRRQEQPRESDTAAAAPTARAITPRRKPLWERAAELRKSIPEEEWDKLPTDGAAQLDHYLYGSPKRPTA